MLDESVCHFKGCPVYFVAFILFLMKILFANNAGPDQTPHYVESDPGLHYVPMNLLQVSRYEWIKVYGYNSNFFNGSQLFVTSSLLFWAMEHFQNGVYS